VRSGRPAGRSAVLSVVRRGVLLPRDRDLEFPPVLLRLRQDLQAQLAARTEDDLGLVASDSEIAWARTPSAIRVIRSATSADAARPSNSKLRESPTVGFLRRGNPNERSAGPAQLDADVVHAFLLLHLDLEQEELGGGQRRGPLIAPNDPELTGKQPLREFGQVEGGRIAPCPTLEPCRDLTGQAERRRPPPGASALRPGRFRWPSRCRSRHLVSGPYPVRQRRGRARMVST
jgi:hypothetical protein